MSSTVVAHSELLYSAVKESDLRNFHAEQILNSWGCLWLTRVLGPAPGVRFLLSSPIGKEKPQCGLHVFFLFFIFLFMMLLLLQSLRLHNIVRPTLGLQLFCLDVISRFYNEKKYLASLQPSSEKQCWDPTRATERSSLLLHHILWNGDIKMALKVMTVPCT